MRQWLGETAAIVRCMPNTPALVRCGVTGIYVNKNVTSEQKEFTESILRVLGLTVFVDSDEEIDTVTAVSGSGPAYFFLLMEAMRYAAEQLGLAPEKANALTLQTALGAARLAVESGIDVATLVNKLLLPGGTTEQAIHVFEQQHFRHIVFEAMEAAKKHRDVVSAN